MALSSSERNAFHKAISLHAAALVVRRDFGKYLVPSASHDGERYLVTGTGMLASGLHCSCPAGAQGKPCWHRAAVQIRKAQESAKAQARRLTRRPASHNSHNSHNAPAITVLPGERLSRQSMVTLTVGGVTYRGTGSSRLEALANATATAA